MRHRVIMAVFLSLLFLFIMSLPTLAYEYRSTRTRFVYVGKVFHEKEISISGGKVDFLVEGVGIARGSHTVHSVKYPPSPVEWVYGEAPQEPIYGNKLNMFVNIWAMTDINAAFEDRMTIYSGIELENYNTTLNTGMAMDPGESGYIIQTIASNVNEDGQYLKINNQFGNTGGVTVRELEIKGYIKETLRVEGSADVWESATVTKGNAKTGWWDTGP